MIKRMSIFLALTMMATNALGGEIAGYGTYSKGYRVGYINKISIKGWVWKSLEGELTMGEGSGLVYIRYSCDEGTCRKQINPWQFSGDTSDYEYVDSLARDGEPLVIKYLQVHLKSIKRDTDYNLMEVHATLDSGEECVMDRSEISGSRSEGFRRGRIVKLSYKGTFVKTYEAIIQVGGAGSQFIAMTLPNEAMYKCALTWLKAFKMVVASYKQGYFSGLQGSTYTMYRIEGYPF